MQIRVRGYRSSHSHRPCVCPSPQPSPGKERGEGAHCTRGESGTSSASAGSHLRRSISERRNCSRVSNDAPSRCISFVQGRASAIPQLIRPGSAGRSALSHWKRAQGMPGEGLTHGPPATKNAGGRYHRCCRSTGIPCAMGFSAASRSPWCAGLVGHHDPRGASSAVANVTPASGCQDAATSRPRDVRSSARSFEPAANSRGHRSPPRVS